MPLTDNKVRTAKPQGKIYRLSDSGGMYLEVMPNGARYWRLKYRYAGREKRLALGVYPAVTLATARALRDAAKAKLSSGIDPSQARQDAKREAALAASNSFEAVAREWHALKAKSGWTPGHATKVLQAFEQLIFPAIGRRPVNAIKPSELLAVLRAIQSRGTIDRAKRQRQKCGEVFRYAIVTGRAETNPATDLGTALQPTKHKHYAALTADHLPAFMRALGTATTIAQTTRLGLRLLALTFVRPGELQAARWAEIDWDAALWTIPAERMKKRREHIVPLSGPALTALRELHALTGKGALLLPGRDNAHKPISGNTFRLALHRMGFAVTAHGFRSTASTILNETGFRSDVIEAQLAHVETNKVRKAYNRAQYLDERRDMMRHWGEYLAAQELGQNVIPINLRKGTKPD